MDLPEFEAPEAVKARYGSFQAPTVCDCERCRMAGVTQGPVLVPHYRKRPDGTWDKVGRWVHGIELRRRLQARERFMADFERITGRKFTEE